jgi:hypothetical protein
MAASFDLCPVLLTHSSFDSSIWAFFYAASFDLCPMLNTNSSIDSLIWASFTAASFDLCPMRKALSSFALGILFTPLHTTFTSHHDGIVVSDGVATITSVREGDVSVFASFRKLMKVRIPCSSNF